MSEQALWEDLGALTHVEEDPEYEIVRPTAEAVSRARDAVLAALAEMGSPLPPASPSPDGRGGLRIHWRREGRNLQLNVPAQEDAPLTIFHRDGFSYAVERNQTVRDLARWLDWFGREDEEESWRSCASAPSGRKD